MNKPKIVRSSGLRALPARSRSNLSSTWQRIRARRARSGGGLPYDRRFLSYGLAALVLTAAAVVLLDAGAAEMHRHWPDWLYRPARLTTDIGLSGWYIVPALIVLLLVNLTDWGREGRRRLLRLYNWTGFAFYVLLSVGLAGIIVTIFKHLIGRARPHAGEGAFSFHPFSGSTYASFPSGHSTTVGAVTAILFLFVPRLRPIVLPLGLWLIFTRVVVGAHFPADVIAGFSFGFGFAVLMAMIFARLGYVFRWDGVNLPRRKPSFFL